MQLADGAIVESTVALRLSSPVMSHSKPRRIGVGGSMTNCPARVALSARSAGMVEEHEGEHHPSGASDSAQGPPSVRGVYTHCLLTDPHTPRAHAGRGGRDVGP